MKITKSKRNNLIFFALITLIIIPQTRHPIQVVLHSVLSKFGPSIIDVDDQKTISYASWQLKDLNGNSLNFNETKGEVVFVNFWATWCPPCIAEFQAIQDLYSDYNDKVKFILVSNELPEIISKFLNKKGYSVNVYRPLSDYPDEFNPRSIPRTYLIDKNGNIVIDKKGAANWNSEKVRNQLDLLLEQ